MRILLIPIVLMLFSQEALAEQRKNRNAPRNEQLVCVVTPDRSERRRDAEVCPVYFGTVGSSCRCQNVSDRGRVQRAR